jgi:hypothetical protein
MSLGMGLSAIGTGVSAFGQYQQGQSMQSAANYNAAVAEQQAGMIEASGELEAYKIRKQGETIKGTQRARYAASGIRTTGSAAEVLADTAASIQLDMDIARYNTQVGAMGARSQAAMSRYQGQQYAQAGRMGAFTTLIGGLGSMASKYYGGSGLTVSNKDKATPGASAITTALDMSYFR